MLKLEFDPASIASSEIFIGGIQTHIYNLDSVLEYVKNHQASLSKFDKLPINVLYLSHHRGGDYTYTEAIAQKIILGVETARQIPILGVTFDIRNHGERTVEKARNSTWKSGNETHAIDMLSCIEGGVHDLKLIMDYLPSYLDLESHLTARSRELEIELDFKNILSGYSMGGHTVIRFASQYPDLVSILNPNIGCCDLSTLLINRLKKTQHFDKKFFYSNYEDLALTEEQKYLYPEALHKKVSSEDSEIFENFKFQSIDLFAAFYDEDPLVPSKISKTWINIYLNSNTRSECYFEKGSVHDISPEMICSFVEWLIDRL